MRNPGGMFEGFLKVWRKDTTQNSSSSEGDVDMLSADLRSEKYEDVRRVSMDPPLAIKSDEPSSYRILHSEKSGRTER